MRNPQINFFTRKGCGLCRRALVRLLPVAERLNLDVRLRDITESTDLLDRYQNDIPVATLGDTELFRHRCDARKVERLLKELV